MTFLELQHHIQQSAPDRIPGPLMEMQSAMRLALFLNATTHSHYDSVSKDADFENDGVDVYLFDSGSPDQGLYVQVTRAREYNMSPSSYDYGNNAILSGKPVIDAIQYKCSIYQPRGVYTRGIVLLVVGVTPVSIIHELVERGELGNVAPIHSCFQAVYYETGSHVVRLV